MENRPNDFACGSMTIEPGAIIRFDTDRMGQYGLSGQYTNLSAAD